MKSPLASACLVCSSLRNRVSVTMLVLTFSPLSAILTFAVRVSRMEEIWENEWQARTLVGKIETAVAAAVEGHTSSL